MFVIRGGTIHHNRLGANGFPTRREIGQRGRTTKGGKWDDRFCESARGAKGTSLVMSEKTEPSRCSPCPPGLWLSQPHGTVGQEGPIGVRDEAHRETTGCRQLVATGRKRLLCILALSHQMRHVPLRSAPEQGNAVGWELVRELPAKLPHPKNE